MNAERGMVFGELLASLRTRVGMTQEELAGASGLSVRSIRDLERGKVARPRRRSLELLVTALNLDQEQARTLIGVARGVSTSWPGHSADHTARPTEPAPKDSSLVPRQLPAAARHFTGRDTELDLLTGLLGQPDTAVGGTVVISAIDGMAGIGKTALAVHAAHRLAERFPDGQLFIDLHGYTQGYPPREPHEVLETFLRALGVSARRIPDALDERSALYRQRLADTTTLIVLDNAASEAQVRPLLPGSAGCLVLITSRRRLKGIDDAQSVSLDLLSPADAVALLRAVAGPGRVATDDPLASEIAELCGRLPLAVRIAATLLRHRPAWSLQHLAQLLRDQHRRVRAFTDGDRDLGTVFDLSYTSLGEQQQLLFRRLGLIPGPDTDAYATAALIDTDPDTAARLLGDLVDHNLLIEHTPGRFRLHDLLRLHARALTDHEPAEDRQPALEHLLDYYQHTAAEAEMLISQYHFQPAPSCEPPAHAPVLTNSDAAWRWLRSERPNLLAALDHTAHADVTRLVALTIGVATLLDADGPWTQAAALHTEAAATASRTGDRTSHAAALLRLGRTQTLQGNFADAADIVQEALSLFQELGEHRGQADTLTQLGQIRVQTDKAEEAAQHQQQALCLYQSLGDRCGQATAQFRLGGTRRMLGEYRPAFHHLQQALDLFQELGEGLGQANALIELSKIHQLTGDYSAATRDLEQAMGLYRDLGNRHGQAGVLLYLGQTRTLTGDYHGALRDLQQCLQLSQTLHDQHGQACALAELGTARRLLDNSPGALGAIEQSVALFRAMGATSGEAWALNHYAAALKAAGDPLGALTAFHTALQLAREIHQPDDEALALEGIAECHIENGNLKNGINHLTQALEIFRRLGMTPDANRAQDRLKGLLAMSSYNS